MVKPDTAKGGLTAIHTDTIKGKNGEYTIVRADTVKHIDSVSLKDKKDKDDDTDIKDKITYKAKDSIVYDIVAKKMYLYNGAETHYPVSYTHLPNDATLCLVSNQPLSQSMRLCLL